MLKRNDWMNMSLTYNWGISSYLRGGSARKLEYRDTLCDFAHGAERTGPMSRTLGLILRPGDAHKEKHENARVVGAWRHREWLLCSVASTVMTFFVRLKYNPAVLNFLSSGLI